MLGTNKERSEDLWTVRWCFPKASKLQSAGFEFGLQEADSAKAQLNLGNRVAKGIWDP